MYRFIKRVLDLLIAVMMFIVAMPIFCFVVILIWISIGRPVFFRQERTGRGMKTFYILKFRTMKVKKDASEKDSERMTKVGYFLRKTSLDELPQLLNIISGDMSFIGPRPLLTDYNKYYSKEELRRFDVRPGMSGYAEIKGRHQISWKQQFEYDVYYVDQFSFVTDIKIFLLTIPKVLNFKKTSSLSRSDGKRLDLVREPRKV